MDLLLLTFGELFLPSRDLNCMLWISLVLHTLVRLNKNNFSFLFFFICLFLCFFVYKAKRPCWATSHVQIRLQGGPEVGNISSWFLVLVLLNYTHTHTPPLWFLLNSTCSMLPSLQVCLHVDICKVEAISFFDLHTNTVPQVPTTNTQTLNK